jgi:hypothetical protein
LAAREEEKLTRLLREGLEALHDEVRVAFVLRDLVELPVEEVAVVLGTSSQTAIQRGHSARLMFRGLLDCWFNKAGTRSALRLGWPMKAELIHGEKTCAPSS